MKKGDPETNVMKELFLGKYTTSSLPYHGTRKIEFGLILFDYSHTGRMD